LPDNLERYVPPRKRNQEIAAAMEAYAQTQAADPGYVNAMGQDIRQS
jgi:hypothetical protein